MNKLRFFTLITVLAVTAFLVLPRAQTGLAAPPTNDDFYSATVVSGLPFSDSIDTTEATVATYDPFPCGAYPNASVWYTFTPDVNMWVEFGTNGSSYSTAVGVYTGSIEQGLGELTCTYNNTADVYLSAGTPYYFLIVSIDGPGGSLQFNLNLMAAPSNDHFSNATIIDTLPFQDPADNTFSTPESGEPDPGCTYEGVYNTIWYAYTPTEAGVLIGSTNNYPYNFVGVYTGSALNDLTLATCTNWGNSFQVDITPGTTVYIQIGSPWWSYGQTNLSLSFATRPLNDDFANATSIDTFPFQDSVDNTYATSEAGEPSNCTYSGPIRTIWYSYTPTEAGVLSGSTNYNAIAAIYTGSSIDSLTQVTCSIYGNPFLVDLTPGTTIYIQIGSIYEWDYGLMSLSLSFIPAPPNDNFAGAELVNGVPFSSNFNNISASTETGEPNPACFNNSGDTISRTVWFQYTPAANESITAEKNGFNDSFIAVYTGSDLNNLTLLNCQAYNVNRVTIAAQAGVTYYFQIGSVSSPWYGDPYGDLSFNLYVPPPPTADFYWYPGDPNRFETVQFCDYSYDPVGAGFSEFWWDFGDGAQEGPSSSSCAGHFYGADGDYTVTHSATTTDGRNAEVTKVVQVRTHDVAITKFAVPQSARVGQTRTIVVGIRNNLYREDVTVELYKSTPNGYTYVGRLTQYVPVRPSGRTTDFNFSYTFSPEDSLMGKVTFKAYAYLNGARDAQPADNEAISLPTKVTGGTPYTATISNPPGVTGAASMFGLMGSGLAFGAILVNGRPKKWGGRKEKRNG